MYQWLELAQKNLITLSRNLSIKYIDIVRMIKLFKFSFHLVQLTIIARFRHIRDVPSIVDITHNVAIQPQMKFAHTYIYI